VDVDFVWVDVFAEVALAGNPLPLVPSADGLSEERLRAIAREFNQSETTFLTAPTTSDADHRLRSFTPAGVEVDGAGHNAMGAWIWLAGSGRLEPGRTDYRQQIGAEVLPVRVRTGPEGRPEVAMAQGAPQFLRRVTEQERLADVLSLDRSQLGGGATEVVSTGVAHLLVAVRSREAVDAAVPDAPRLAALLVANGAEGCYLYSTEPGQDGADAYARFFNPTVGIAEDPATGTAAGPLAALLVRDGLRASGGTVHILQGAALGRPSILRVLADGDRVELSGTGLVVADGTLHL
jgi:PhzF family phenazine biosynthesis protein